MSRYSGKCDLADMIGMERMYPRDPANPNSPLVSDELECFRLFRQETGGVIYQHHKVTVTEQNQEFVERHCPEFKANARKIRIKDARFASGFREKTQYDYEYYGKKYGTLKELNRHGVWIVKEIRFGTLLDLLPYYPYIVTASFSDGARRAVFISKESFVDSEEKEFERYGIDSEMHDRYRRNLQEHYRDVVLRYYDPAGRTVIQSVSPAEDGTAVLSAPIDDQFEVRWHWRDGAPLPHWCEPTAVDCGKGVIRISGADMDSRLYDRADVEFVRQAEQKKYLE